MAKSDPLASAGTHGSGGWFRRYPPVALILVALLITLAILPSVLNLPQANPRTVLEYAPIPPEDEDSPSSDTGLSSLGLGSTGGSGLGSLQDQTGPVTSRASAERPSRKRCVGTPARQTEDPMSPPCVPYFEGDNGGATYLGVTKDEITVLAYVDYGSYGGELAPSGGTYCDLDAPEDEACPGEEQDHILVRVYRLLARYFNERFQTYGRHVHMWMYVSPSGDPQGRLADAVDNYKTLKPFAVLDDATFGGNNAAYDRAMNRQGTLIFSSQTGQIGADMRAQAPLQWSFWPDVEHQSDLYATYVCQKVLPYQVSHSGNTNQIPRKFGIMRTKDADATSLQYFAQQVKPKLSACGVDYIEDGGPGEENTGQHREVLFPCANFVVCTAGDQSYAATNVAQLVDWGVTTVLWLGGAEGKTTHAADAARYYPEWIVMGDGFMDNLANASKQHPNEWAHAWVVSYVVRDDGYRSHPGYQACREADPEAPHNDCIFATDPYRGMFMMFQGIQVSGPYLTPEAVDTGFHAIPAIRSTNPYQAAFYFDANDFSGVKDAFEAWWDTDSPPPGSNSPGCYKMVRSGKRFPAGLWEGGDDVFANQSDPCNGFPGFWQLRPGAPVEGL